MAVSLHTRIEDLMRKLERLGRKLDALESEKSSLVEVKEDLRAENSWLKGELRQALTDKEYLVMSHQLASDKDEIIVARRKIDSMIRDIDRCISQLKE